MTMIRHDNKTKEKEWMYLFHSIKCFYGLPRTGRIGKHKLTACCIRCDEHQGIVLDRMSLKHTLQKTTAGRRPAPDHDCSEKTKIYTPHQDCLKETKHSSLDAEIGLRHNKRHIKKNLSTAAGAETTSTERRNALPMPIYACLDIRFT